MEKDMIVEKQDLAFLLSGKGCTSFPAFCQPEEAGEPEKILERLFRRGQIRNETGFFQVEETLGGAVTRMAEARSVLGFCHGNPRRELLYLYPGERMLALQEIRSRRNALRLTYVPRESLRQYLQEQGLLGEEEGWEPLPYTEGPAELMPERIESRGVLKEYPWIRLLVTVSDPGTGQELRRLAVIRKGLQEVLVTEEAQSGARQLEDYREERLLEQALEAEA